MNLNWYIYLNYIQMKFIWTSFQHTSAWIIIKVDLHSLNKNNSGKDWGRRDSSSFRRTTWHESFEEPNQDGQDCARPEAGQVGP